MTKRNIIDELDPFDAIDAEETDPLDGFHLVGETTGSDDRVCEWGCGDSEGLCVLERFGCHQLGCVLVSEL